MKKKQEKPDFTWDVDRRPDPTDSPAPAPAPAPVPVPARRGPGRPRTKAGTDRDVLAGRLERLTGGLDGHAGVAAAALLAAVRALPDDWRPVPRSQRELAVGTTVRTRGRYGVVLSGVVAELKGAMARLEQVESAAAEITALGQIWTPISQLRRR